MTVEPVEQQPWLSSRDARHLAAERVGPLECNVLNHRKKYWNPFQREPVIGKECDDIWS